jgi:hypothetical protein
VFTLRFWLLRKSHHFGKGRISQKYIHICYQHVVISHFWNFQKIGTYRFLVEKFVLIVFQWKKFFLDLSNQRSKLILIFFLLLIWLYWLLLWKKFLKKKIQKNRVITHNFKKYGFWKDSCVSLRISNRFQ